MKALLTILFCALLLLLTMGPVNAPGRVVLTAEMVQSATDIEAAIIQATHGGTRPGLVILDGRDGPFKYAQEAEDLDVNIFVSDLILRGTHKAVLQEGAINLDGRALHNITIEGLEILCPQDCITSRDGLNRNIIVRRNRLWAGNNGIDVDGMNGWQIKNNRIEASHMAIHLVSTNGTKILNNQLQADIPVMLEQSDNCKIILNTITADRDGVHLGNDSQANQVIANSISTIQGPGITLKAGASENEVFANWAVCAEGSWAPCPVTDWGEDNRTWGNGP